MSIERRTLGRTGMQVSALGFGGSETGYGGHAVATVAKILNSALDDGLNLIDTAACYGDGEDQIGRAVAGRRKDFFLMTKCGHAVGATGHDWDPKMMARSIDRSLKRLRTDYVDVMQLHSCSAATLREGKAIEVLARARARPAKPASSATAAMEATRLRRLSRACSTPCRSRSASPTRRRSIWCCPRLAPATSV
jgi:aryl-alcohol dehydrogenase-like predicted oxidoreductase